MNRILLISIVIITGACSAGSLKRQPVPEQKTSLVTNSEGNGTEIIIEADKGESFYYPLFAFWIEDMDGNYLQTLYVAKSVATGYFKYARQERNKWIGDFKRAPQTLPYWAHKRGIRATDGLYMPDAATQVPDAYTGATPVTGFILSSRTDKMLPDKFRVMLEINQNWDWNKYWTNDKYPDDENYKMSCQPAVVYEAVVEMYRTSEKYEMKPVGHSHYSGKTGELFPDLSTLTTALKIFKSVTVSIKPLP